MSSRTLRHCSTASTDGGRQGRISGRILKGGCDGTGKPHQENVPRKRTRSKHLAKASGKSTWQKHQVLSEFPEHFVRLLNRCVRVEGTLLLEVLPMRWSLLAVAAVVVSTVAAAAAAPAASGSGSPGSKANFGKRSARSLSLLGARQGAGPLPLYAPDQVMVKLRQDVATAYQAGHPSAMPMATGRMTLRNLTFDHAILPTGWTVAHPGRCQCS